MGKPTQHKSDQLLDKKENDSLGTTVNESIGREELEKLVPVFSENEKSDMLLYHQLSKQYTKMLNDEAMGEFKEHPVWGPMIAQMSAEMIEESNKASQKLQEDAIVNDNWIPYIENSFVQGRQYANMGVRLKDWLDLILIAKKYIVSILQRELKDDSPTLISAYRGMNLLTDIGLYFIGEAYLREEKKKIEKATLDIIELRESSKYTRSLFEANLDPLATISVSGKLMDVNNALVKATGVPRENLLGTDFSIYFQNPGKARKIYEEVFEKEIIVDYPLTIKHKNGHLTEVLYNASVYKDDSGKVIGAFASARDITLQKELNELEQIKKVEQKREEYTNLLELKNTQLLDFCNIVSHNLRAPLTNISMLVDIIKLAETDEERMEIMSKIKPVAQHLNEVFNELLESVQIREDTEIQSDRLNLEEMLNAVLVNYETQIKAFEADINVDFSAAAEVVFPQKYLESILANLIGNSLKYRSPERKLSLEVRTEKTPEGIILSVADNGLGIDLERHSNALFKIRKVFHDHPEAKGFGLFLIKTQIDSMGGEIWAESAPNVGSTFYVKFKNNNI